MKKYLSLIFIGFTLNTEAQIFNATVTDYDGLDSIPLLKGVIDQEVQKIEDDVNEKIPNGSPRRIMEGMSNASVFAGKGTASDYSSHLEKYMIAVAVGGAADLDRPTGTDSDISGIGAAPALVVGLNMNNLGVENFAGLDTKRLNIYANYMQYGRAESLNPWIGMESEASVDMKTVGARMNYDWIEPKEYRHFTWGGIRLNWGYQYNETEFTFEHNVDETFDIVEGQTSIQGRVTGRPKYRVDVITNSIPLEISTDITVFKFLGFFGGAGVDFNWGSAKWRAVADGDASPLICTDGGAVCGGGRNLQMQVQATGEASGQVDPVTARAFLGTQINLPYIQLYGQVDRAVNTELLGVAVGIRFVR